MSTPEVRAGAGDGLAARVYGRLMGIAPEKLATATDNHYEPKLPDVLYYAYQRGCYMQRRDGSYVPVDPRYCY